MKPQNTFACFVVSTTLIAVALAYPQSQDSASLPDTDNGATDVSRSRRDLTGVFDSIANGVGGLMDGMKKVSSSIMKAFDSVFSENNLNALSDGFTKFKQGVKDAFSGMFGKDGVVSKGFKKIGKSLGGSGNNDNTKPPQTPKSIDPSNGGNGGHQHQGSKRDAPTGDIPNEETT